jgi:predicted branched-subunit amino acid permease
VTGLAVFVLWNVMTATGALIGDALGDPRKYGLDAAASAAFLALLWPRLLHGRDGRATALVAVLLAAAVAPFTPAGVPVLVGAVAAVLVGLAPRPTREGQA